MIKISAPYIYDACSRARLASRITIDDNTSEVWFDVEYKYKDYLCHERSDAFVVGLLHYAMHFNHDIECEAPMGEFLYYQLVQNLIPAVCSGSSRMHRIKVVCSVDSSLLDNAGAVGTGISCGVDSLNTLASDSSCLLNKHKITHLTLFNVGAYGENERANRLFEKDKKKAIEYCHEFGYNLIVSDSNIMNVIPQNHYLTSTYTCGFAILCLQKLYSIYYLASSTTFKNYTILENDLTDSSKYDLLSCYCFSTDQIKIYTEGAELSRLEKIKRIANFEPATRYLHVCTEESFNCCQCEKCLRTITELESIGALHNFSRVFDLGKIERNRHLLYQKMYKLLITKNDYRKYYKEVYPYYKSKISVSDKLNVWWQLLKEKVKYYYWKFFIKQKEDKAKGSDSGQR